MNDHLKWANGTALSTIQSAQEAARAYLRVGLCVIPIPRGKKKPRLGEWQKCRFSEADVPHHFNTDGNVGVLLGEPSGHLVDVDLDCPEAVALAPHLLPPTQAIFGRRSKPNSHWLYIAAPSPSKTLKLTDERNGTLVELRSNGGQTVFPPSRHPSGEPVTWSVCAGPAIVSPAMLERAVRALAAAALLARHWLSDGRHELSMPVGGVLARAGYTPDEIERIVGAICAYANDPKPDDRVRTARDAAERVAEGQAAYGMPHLAELLGEAVAGALAKILALPREPKSPKQEATTQRDRAIGCLDTMDFWLSTGGEAYVSVNLQGRWENHRVRSRAFKRIVQARATAQEGRHVPKAAIEEALASAEAQAASSGMVHEVYLRVASHDGIIYIDIGGPDWRAVRVSPEGWTIVDHPPVKFIRPPGVKPLPVPEPGGTLADLRPLINVAEESDFRLFVAAMLAAFIADKPYPILIVSGEQGTSKTTLCRIFKLMVDPHDIDARSPPRGEQDLFVGAGNAHVLTFDNISHIPSWLSDALCRLATGGAFASRELYTDREEVLIKAKRPVVLNGIPFTVERPDLLDRSIVLILPVIPPENRMDEEEYWAAIERIRPKMFGLFLTALSTALRNIQHVQLPSRPRMADLAKWLTAAEPAFGWEPGTFVRDFQERRTRSMRELADDVVVSTLRDMVNAHKGPLSLTASELLRRMNSWVEFQNRPRDWPRSPNRLSGQVRALAPALRELGIEVDMGQRRASDNNRLIVLRPTHPSPPPKPSRPSDDDVPF